MSGLLHPLRRPIVIIGLLFAVFGFVTWIGPVLIPYLRIACELSGFASYLVAFAFYISYTVMAVPAAALLRRTGYKKGMWLGLLVMALGSLFFLPAAFERSYQLFLVGLFIQGTGLAILQTAANPYVTILGPLESAARRMGIMGICNGIAGIIAPLIIGSITLNDADEVRDSVARLSGSAKAAMLDGLAHRVIFPYAIISGVLLLLAVWVFYSPLPEIYSDENADVGTGGETEKTSIFQFPYLLLGVMTLFLYVGVEVISGDSIISYGASQGIRLSTARFFSIGTLGCMQVGYLLGIFLIPKYLSQARALMVSAALGLLFVFAALSTKGLVSVTFIALLGLANSMCWPSIWPLAIDGLGRFTPLGSSLLIVAIGGGAVLPLTYGWLAQVYTPQHAYLLVVPCYCCIAWYAAYGHRIGRKILVA